MIEARQLLLGFLIFCCLPATSQTSSDTKMNTFISTLMKKMTLEEKIGQMNLPTVGFDVTGPL